MSKSVHSAFRFGTCTQTYQEHDDQVTTMSHRCRHYTVKAVQVVDIPITLHTALSPAVAWKFLCTLKLIYAVESIPSAV